MLQLEELSPASPPQGCLSDAGALLALLGGMGYAVAVCIVALTRVLPGYPATSIEPAAIGAALLLLLQAGTLQLAVGVLLRLLHLYRAAAGVLPGLLLLGLVAAILALMQATAY